MITFWKYEALGNDFIIIEDPRFDRSRAAALCDRHFGIGADGILLLQPSVSADARMVVLNSDGSEAEMCGNGIRCFIRHLSDIKQLRRDLYRIETGAGIIPCRITQNGELQISVLLGRVDTSTIKQDKENSSSIEYQGREFAARAISFGNPHLVLRAENLLPPQEAKTIASVFQNSCFFEGPANVEVITKLNIESREVHVIVNERGAGFTLACGTGGAAVTTSLIMDQIARKGEEWNVIFPGGKLRYLIDNIDQVWMKGPARFIFRGELDA